MQWNVFNVVKKRDEMRSFTAPKALAPGSKIACYSPSFPGAALFPRRLERSIRTLREQNFDVFVPDAALRNSGYVAGSKQERAEELMRLFLDDTIDGIFCCLGGFNSNEILPYLNYEAIANHPKILIGYSDVTCLLLAIYAKTGLITFHGPCVIPEWGEYPTPFPEMVEIFLDVLTARKNIPLHYQCPFEWTHEFLDWADNKDSRPRTMLMNTGWHILKAGSAEGCLIGGNVETINMLCGTSYCPDFSNCILFLEATETEAYLPRLQRALSHLEAIGIFQRITALLIGKCPDSKPQLGMTLEKLICSFTENLDIPVVLNMDIGHTDPMLTLPIVIQAHVECDKSVVHFSLLERAVVV